MSEHFFSRWSQRKQAVAKGLPVAEPVAPASPAELPGVPGSSEGLQRSKAAPPALAPGQAEAKSSEMPAEPLPSLDDARALTPDSDFQPFMRSGVTADVRNVAMKKLFTDPHFNVMDGLDIYIDDYSKHSPLSAAEMAKMVGAQFLKLVDDPNEVKIPAPAPVVADQEHAAEPEEAQAPQAGAPEQVAQPEPQETHDDHADLQLQPDHAPEPPGPGPGAG